MFFNVLASVAVIPLKAFDTGQIGHFVYYHDIPNYQTALFGATVFFQLVNLPVEIDASNRAKAQLVGLGIVPTASMSSVNSVLNAAAWTYVAATLQSVLTLLYYASYLTGGSSSDSDQ